MSARVRPAFSQRLGHALLRRDADWLCTQGINAAIRRSLAVIEFTIDGVVLDANQVFLDAMGYRRDEVVGKHRRQFLHPEDSSSADYQVFWNKLAAGEFVSGQFRRLDKRGRDV